LRVTETGQVATSLHAETSFSLNLRDAEAPAATRGRHSPLDEEYASRTVASAKRLSGYRDPGTAETPLFMGRNRREGYSIEKYVLRGEGDYPIPYLLFLPDDHRPHPAVVYLDPAGKGNGAGRHGPIEDLVRQGFVVIAPDLLGVGEMAPTDFQSGTANPRAITWLWFGGLSVGRSIAGLRAADVVRLVRAIRTRPDILPGRVRGIAFGEAGSVLLHAAAFEPGISAVALIHPLVSYSNLVATRFYQPRFTSGGVAAMLTEYDLPDLAATLAPRPLLVLGAVDGAGRPLPPESVRAEWRRASARYSGVHRAPALQIVPSSATERESRLLARWLADPAGGG
jgi:dienelactone hydrolase